MKEFLVYRNRFNEVKPFEVEIVSENEMFFDVYDIIEKKRKTFLIENILSKHASFSLLVFI